MQQSPTFEMSLEALFCAVDDFCRVFEQQWQQRLINSGVRCRRRAGALSLSERMTIVIAFHQQRYRTFKDFYQRHVCIYWRTAFPKLMSYQRFVEWLPSLLVPLCVYLKHCFGRCTGLSFLDATSVKVWHNRRISRHRVFKGLAARGKTSVDWFFGFKLHLVVNEHGELLNRCITPGNADDRKPVPELLKPLFGKVFADRGYASTALAQ